jgi:hypothetical protein
MVVAASAVDSVRRYVRPDVEAAAPAHPPGLAYRQAA